jgi:putative GTP pyrophosphokinase
MREKTSFLAEYCLTEEQFKKTGLNWDDLVEIEKDYLSLSDQLLPAAEHISKILRLSGEVHSIRFRLKNSESLIAKIIRKKSENPDKIIDLANYKEVFTDLIGVRIIHLFKADWQKIHTFILENFDVIPNETVVYYREGDEIDGDLLMKSGCRSEKHKRNYRSVHYLISPPTCKPICRAEIQVRTIYEEAWGEIDHTTNYPNASKHVLLTSSIDQLNRLSGACDDLATFICNLESDFEKKETERAEMTSEINSLRETINSLEIKQTEKDEIIAGLKKIEIRSSFIYGTTLVNTGNHLISVESNVLSSVHGMGIVPKVINSSIIPSGTIYAGGSVGSESILGFKGTK